ncbi:MAG TPA: zinc-dependent metalloprotease family protein [Cyclobacteriaceae bacterium]|nr:zinc-dependent metalloprotease family protein [Cyclobacteriaceae bacterium]
MRRIFTFLIFFISTTLAVFAQPERRTFLKSISEDASTVLSNSSVERFEKLSGYGYYKEAYIVRISSVKEFLQNGRLVMDMPGKSGRRIDLRTKHSFASSINESQWFGEFSDGDALLIDKDGHSFGHVRIGKNNYDIHYLENGYAGVFLIDSEFIKQTECGTVHVPDSEKSVDESETEFSMMSSSQPIVRVLVLYSQAAQNSGYNIPNVVQLAFSQFVTASINSNVVVGLHLAGLEFLDFSESNSAQNDVLALRNNTTAQQLRNTYEADLVMLLTDGSYGNTRGTTVQVGPIEQDAYGLVQIGYAASSSTYTFTHEIAHLFGARHQFAADDTPGDAHAHGWETGFWPFKKKFSTVVHKDDGSTRLLYFSNPYISHKWQPYRSFRSEF